ncbi:MAG: glycosyltransferase family 87 protein [Candidatus Velthaea sp.]|jgi:hypothetical protein
MPLLVTVFAGLSLVGYFSLFQARYCDFRAFYCSGSVTLAGADAYREHPLHECEQSLPPHFLSSLPAEVTIPAPYPGYALALFSLVARLPFDTAVIVWTLGSCFALGAAIVTIARLTATPLPATAVVLAFPAAIVSLPLGQPALLVLFAIAACAALLHGGRPRCAALAALVTAIDPHVGLAVCLGLFVAVSRARPILLAGAGILLAGSILAYGPAREWEYLHDVLPLHSLVNVPEFSQYSVANLAFGAGLSRGVALLAGNVWYALSLVVGVVVACRLRPRLGTSAVAFVPVAFAVFGGAHTHLQQLSLAIPAFLLLTSAASGRRRALFAVATFAAAMPWLVAAPFVYLFPATALLGIVFARCMKTPRIGMALGAGSFVVLTLLYLAVAGSHAVATPIAAPQGGNPLAEVAWGSFVNATSLPAQAWFFAGKIPTLLGFGVMLTALAAAARTRAKSDPVPA